MFVHLKRSKCHIKSMDIRLEKIVLDLTLCAVKLALKITPCEKEIASFSMRVAFFSFPQKRIRPQKILIYIAMAYPFIHCLQKTHYFHCTKMHTLKFKNISTNIRYDSVMCFTFSTYKY